jgi:type II secretory pathway component PulJ
MKNNTASGFSLPEFMVYLFLTTFLVLCVSTWFTTAHRYLVRYQGASNNVLMIAAAGDLLARDVTQAQGVMPGWKLIADEHYVWSVHDGDVGWQLCGNRLMRSYGQFDAHKKVWVKRTTALIAEPVTHFVVEQEKRHIRCSIAKDGTPYMWLIEVKNRVV